MGVFHKLDVMSYFGSKLSEHLNGIGLTKYRLAKLSGIAESSVINIANGKRRPTDDILAKFAAVSELNLALDTLRGWRALDDYSERDLMEAIKAQYESVPAALQTLLERYPDDQELLWMIHHYGTELFEQAQKQAAVGKRQSTGKGKSQKTVDPSTT